MALLTFKGGIHPYDGKELSKDKPISELLPGRELVYLMSQHIGAPATPVVSAGQRVLRGQLIAEASGFVSSPVYASVSGIVKSIGLHRTVTGEMADAVTVENDEKYEEVNYEAVEDPFMLEPSEILKKIEHAGVVGMGGAGFPTHVKLAPKNPDQIEFVIANCAECEPYLTADYRRMLEQPKQLIDGMKIILKLFPQAKGIFGIEDNKPECISLLKELTASEERMEVITLETKYPQGGERQLIYAVTRKKINSKMLPADVGCIVDNVETLIAVEQAVREGKPVMNRVFTLTGKAVREPQNYMISIGTSYQHILDAAGGFKSECQKAISGGPMMGFALFGFDVPTTKTTSALLCMAEDEVAEMEPTACINCGRCTEACPEQLVPSRLANFSEHAQKEAFEKWYGLECVECGSCSFVCPAKRHLAQSVRFMKKQVLADKRKK